MIDLFIQLPKRLERSIDKLEKKFDYVKEFRNKVADKTIEHEYCMNDKLKSVSIVVGNFNNCNFALKTSMEIKKTIEEVVSSILYAAERAQLSPNCELLASRGLQAASEGLVKPKDIVKKFWPLI